MSTLATGLPWVDGITQYEIAKAIILSGALMKNNHRQPMCPSSAPPNIGPKIGAVSRGMLARLKIRASCDRSAPCTTPP